MSFLLLTGEKRLRTTYWGHNSLIRCPIHYPLIKGPFFCYRISKTRALTGRISNTISTMMAAIRVSVYGDAFGLRELIGFKPKD